MDHSSHYTHLARDLSSEVVGADTDMGGVDSSETIRAGGNSMSENIVGGNNSGTVGGIRVGTNAISIGRGVGSITSIKESSISLGISLPLLSATGNSSSKIVGTQTNIGGMSQTKGGGGNSVDRVGDTSISSSGITNSSMAGITNSSMTSIRISTISIGRGVGSITSIKKSSISLSISISVSLTIVVSSIGISSNWIGRSGTSNWHISSINTGGRFQGRVSMGTIKTGTITMGTIKTGTISIGTIKTTGITIGSIDGISISLSLSIGSGHKGRYDNKEFHFVMKSSDLLDPTDTE